LIAKLPVPTMIVLLLFLHLMGFLIAQTMFHVVIQVIDLLFFCLQTMQTRRQQKKAAMAKDFELIASHCMTGQQTNENNLLLLSRISASMDALEKRCAQPPDALIYKDMFTSLTKLHGTPSNPSQDEYVLQSLKEMQSKIESTAVRVEQLNQILFSLRQELHLNKENVPTISNSPDKQFSVHLTSNQSLNDTEKPKMRTTFGSSPHTPNFASPWTALEPKWLPREITQNQSKLSGAMDLQT